MAVFVGGIRIGVTASTNQAVRGFANLASGIQNAATAAQQFTAGSVGIQSVLNSFATAFQAVDFSSQIEEVTLLAGRVESLGTVLDVVGGSAGFSAGQLTDIEQSVRRLGITTRATRQSLAQLAQANIDLRIATDLTRIAQNAAVIAGVDSSEAFNRLIVSIQRLDARLLKQLGIVVNLNQVYSTFAAQTGKNIRELTVFDRQQAFVNAILERGTLIAGAYEASLGDVFKRFTSLRRQFEEAAVVIGEKFLPLFADVVDSTARFLQFLGESPRFQSFIAGFATFTTVAGPAVLAIGGFAAGLKAVRILAPLVVTALGPIGITLVGITTAVAAAATAFQQFRAEVRAAGEAVEEAARASEAFAFKVVDIRKAVATLVRFAEATDRTREQTQLLNQSVTTLIKRFPELEGEIRRLKIAENFSGILSLVRREAADIIGTNAELVEQANAQIERLTTETANVLRRGFAEEASNTRQGIKVVSDEVAAARAELDELVKQAIAGTLGVSELVGRVGLNFTLAGDAAERVTDLITTIRNLQRTNTQLQLAENTQILEGISAQEESILSLGENVGKLGKQIQRQRLQIVNNDDIKRLDKVLELRSRLTASLFTEVEIREFQQRLLRNAASAAARRSEIEIARLNAQAVLQGTIVSQEQEEAVRARERVRLDQEIENINTRITNLRETQARVVKEQAEAEKLIVSTAEARLAQLQAIREEITAISLGFSNELAKLTRDIEQRDERRVLLAEAVSARLKAIEERRVAAQQQAVNAVISSDRRRFLALARDLKAQEDLVRQAFEQETKIFDAETALLEARRTRLFKQSNQEVREELTRLFTELGELTGRTNFRSLEAVRSLNDQLKENAKSVGDFIDSLQVSETGFRGFQRLNQALRSFQDNIKNATTDEQLRRIQMLFPRQLQRIVRETGNEVDRLREKLERLQRGGTAEAEARQRASERFQQLIQQGFSVQVAQLEEAKLFRSEQEKIRREREEVTEQLTDQEKLFKSLRREARSVRFAVPKDIKAARDALEEQISLRGTQVDVERQLRALEKERISDLKEEINLAIRREGALRAAREGRLQEFARTTRTRGVPETELEQAFRNVPQVAEDRRQTLATSGGEFGKFIREARVAAEFAKKLNAEEKEATRQLKLLSESFKFSVEERQAVNGIIRQILTDAKVGERAARNAGVGR